jgi:hypothetical protein
MAVGGNSMDAKDGLSGAFPHSQIDLDPISFDFFHDWFRHECSPFNSISSP